MPAACADALVLFGASGDLAHQKIFPALQAMVKRGHLDVPVIGVAMSDWNVETLRSHVRESLEKSGGLDPAAFAKLSALLRYVAGNYHDPATWVALRTALGIASRPLHYLAIPPSLFPVVVEGLGKSGSSTGARLVVENGGQVLDQQQVAELSQPFRRLEADRVGMDKGSGLGLSIVAAIAEAHGGTLDLRARPGGGLRVRVDLPAAAATTSAAVPAGAPA